MFLDSLWLIFSCWELLADSASTWPSHLSGAAKLDHVAFQLLTAADRYNVWNRWISIMWKLECFCKLSAHFRSRSGGFKSQGTCFHVLRLTKKGCVMKVEDRRNPAIYSHMERTVFLGSLRPMVTWTAPSLTSLKMPMASWWVRPATDRPFTENISSPENKNKNVTNLPFVTLFCLVHTYSICMV